MNERMPPDISLAVDAGIRWMSYVDIAAARGVSVASATRMARRKKWRRQPGNGPAVLVAVPLAELTRTEPRTKIALPGQSPGQLALSSLDSHPGQIGLPSPDIEAVVRGFEAAIAALGQRAESEAMALHGQIAAAERRADQAEAALAAERAEATRFREADKVRRAAGRMARLKAAWKGE